MRIRYRLHFPGGDWQPWMENGQIAGTLGECRPVDLVQVDAEGVGVAVQVHTEGYGWLDPVGGSETAGVEGHQIEAIRIGLTGENSDAYEVSYRCHVQDYGWLNWTRTANTSGTEGMCLRLEALQIYLGKKGELFYDVNKLEPNLVGLPEVAGQVSESPVSPNETVDARRRRVIDTALSYEGYASWDGYSIFGDRFGDPYGDWCAYFVCSVFEDAGLSHLFKQTGYCPYMHEWFLNDDDAYFYRQGQGYVPQPGDIILFDYNGNGTPDHVGIVDGTDGEVVSTIEGNTSDPPQVKHKVAWYGFGESDIFGYCVPDWGA